MAERNERCPCGSGEKYKKCCAAKDDRKSQFPMGLAILIGAILLLASIGFAPSLFNREESRPGFASAAPAQPAQSAATAPLPADPNNPFAGNRAEAPATTQPAAGQPAVPAQAPAGQAPPGKVWSAEHGHWHDAVAPASPIQIQADQLGAAPRAGGRVPPEPGMVWSEEHNHWHKAPTGTAAMAKDPTTGAPIGTDPTPGPGQVRAFGQLVDVTAQPGTPQPAGEVPAGMVWSREHGHWHDAKTGEAPRP